MSRRILVVEDDYLVALGLEHWLSEAGFQVIGIARTAEEAMTLAAAEQPALAIMAIRMAGARDGIGTAIDLAAQIGVRSIFATSHGDEGTKQRAAKTTPLGWLQKPYSPTTLVSLIDQATR